MGGIRDYTLQNIIFVHDFVFIFLILVFLVILAYFAIVLYEYNDEKYAQYFRLFKGDFIIPMNKWLAYLREEVLVLRKTKDVKTMGINRRIMSKWTNSNYNEFVVIKAYSNNVKNIFNQVHNLSLEVIWTFIPIVIILELIFPSLSLIADDEISNKASIHTVNVIGNQWYWTYEVNVAMGIMKTVSNMLLLSDIDNTVLAKEHVRLLSTTDLVTIPVGLKTSFFITSNDVAHSWAIPGLGLKIDAIPGRINLKTVIASRLGLYTGMCSELCGIEHGFMPISLKVYSFDKWGANIEYITNHDNVSYSNIVNLWYV